MNSLNDAFRENKDVGDETLLLVLSDSCGKTFLGATLNERSCILPWC
jgi:hypothetical protein